MFRQLKELFSNESSTTESSIRSELSSAVRGDTSPLSWWIEEFSQAERGYILKKYQPMVMGLGGDRVVESIRIFDADGMPLIKLTALATWFMSPKEDLHLAIRLLQKGIELGEESQGTVLDQHFTLHNVIRVHYRNRANDVVSLRLAIGACEKQIALAPSAAHEFKGSERMETLPAHTGFEQLSIIKERDKDYDEAILLCEEALRHGWSGDWQKRIVRCKSKRDRSR